MRWCLSSALLLILCWQGVSAQDAEQVNAFNVAWTEYVEAMQSGELKATVRAADRVLSIAKDAYPADNENIPILTHNYGSALLAAGEKEKAREQLALTLELYEVQHGEDSIELVSVLGELADASGGVGHEQRQLRLYKRALRIVENTHGETSPEYGALAYRVARNIYDQSQSQIGKKYMEVAHEIFLAHFGDTDPRVGLTYFYLGKMRFSKGQHKQAARLLEASLPSFEGDSDNLKSLRLVTRALLVQAYESWGKSELATPHCIAIGSESQFSPNQDYQPIFRLVPRYPAELLRRGVEGHVDLEFTIDEDGFVRDPVIIASEHDKIRENMALLRMVSKEDSSFEAAASDVIKRFRYAPRFIDGEAVAVDGVKTRISFEIAD